MFISSDNIRIDFAAPVLNTHTATQAQTCYHYLIIDNFESIANGTCRDLCMNRIDTPNAFDRKVQQLVRSYFNPEGREIYEMHQKIANLDFDNFVIKQDEKTDVISAHSVTIIALNDEEYELMAASFLKEHSEESIERDEAKNQTFSSREGFFSVSLYKAITLLFRKEQEIIVFFKQAREEELARVDEDTRERQTKERDKRWNQRMDYWLQKDSNRREILANAVKISTAAA